MKSLLHKYESQKPEIVFEWKDSHTEAEGWVVINSLRGGAAGGGTRMRKGLTKYEVLSLAKTMEIKFTVCGPPIGGAKSGINFDPNDPRKSEVLKRWYKAVAPLLKNYYGTGGDLNIDEVEEVIPITEDCGVWHPQEGIFEGHYSPSSAEKINRIGQLRYGVKKRLNDINYTPDSNQDFMVADMITGFGVAESIKHYYSIWNMEPLNNKVLVQGWGNVGSSAAYYLAKSGFKIVGIIDKDGGVINENGFSFEEVKNMFLSKKNNQLVVPNILSFKEVNNLIWDVSADVFIPCAASRLLTLDHIQRLIQSGLKMIASGANVPFADQEIFNGPIAQYADRHLSVIPDFISNCGMARVFAYLMNTRLKELTDEGIFEDCSDIIKKALQDCYGQNSDTKNITKTALELALKKLL
ncbi:MAG: amino acid dehydrogenase [Flavobacteriales bacterium]|nr:amino acid dehydrogenase [Flavobacteriales bacterium]|tara:strand:- start:3324 stop:4553 length:1230 start_codon:yes stop_codon:yes gene_type:complete